MHREVPNIPSCSPAVLTRMFLARTVRVCLLLSLSFHPLRNKFSGRTVWSLKLCWKAAGSCHPVWPPAAPALRSAPRGVSHRVSSEADLSLLSHPVTRPWKPSSLRRSCERGCLLQKAVKVGEFSGKLIKSLTARSGERGSHGRP